MAANQLASWLPEVYAGSPNRLIRYMQYDNMDNDTEINTALDTIAEFGTQEDEVSGLPFNIQHSGIPTDTETKILSKTLEQWCNLNQLYKRSTNIHTIKYGDFNLKRSRTMNYIGVTANVEKVVVNETAGKIETYFIKNLDPMFKKNCNEVPYPRPWSRSCIAGIMATNANPRWIPTL